MSKLDNDGEKHSFSLHLTILPTTIAVAILSPVAVVGNALVLAAIWRNQSIRTPSYILLAGLAFTDFCTGLISQPFYVAMELIYLSNPQLETVAKKPKFLVIEAIAIGSASFFLVVAMSTITVMSIERWLHMTRRSMLTVCRACYTVTSLFLLQIPLLVYRLLPTFYHTIYLPEIDNACMSFLLFCLLVTSVAYFKVFRTIRSHQQQIQATNFSQTSAQPAINFAKYKKSVFTILYILAIFYVSYSPLAIFWGLVQVPEIKYESVATPFFNVSMVFLFLSSSLNPILYLWRMKDIRKEVKRLVKGILCKVSS